MKNDGNFTAAAKGYAEAALLMVGFGYNKALFAVWNSAEECFRAANDILELAEFREKLAENFSELRKKVQILENAASAYSQIGNSAKAIECMLPVIDYHLEYCSDNHERIIGLLNRLQKDYEQIEDEAKVAECQIAIAEQYIVAASKLEDKNSSKAKYLHKAGEVFELLEMENEAGMCFEGEARLRTHPDAKIQSLGRAQENYEAAGNSGAIERVLEASTKISETHQQIMEANKADEAERIWNQSVARALAKQAQQEQERAAAEEKFLLKRAEEERQRLLREAFREEQRKQKEQINQAEVQKAREAKVFRITAENHEQEGAWGEAAKCFEAEAELRTSAIRAAIAMTRSGICYALDGQKEKADELFDRAMQSSDSPEQKYIIARTWTKYSPSEYPDDYPADLPDIGFAMRRREIDAAPRPAL